MYLASEGINHTQQRAVIKNNIRTFTRMEHLLIFQTSKKAFDSINRKIITNYTIALLPFKYINIIINSYNKMRCKGLQEVQQKKGFLRK